MSAKIEVGFVVLVLIVAMIGGAVAYFAPERVGLEEKFQPADVHGSVRLLGAGRNWQLTPNDPSTCMPAPAFADIPADDVILSSDDEPQGMASISHVGAPDGDGCEFTFDIVVPKKRDAYQLEVKGYGEFTYSYDTRTPDQKAEIDSQLDTAWHRVHRQLRDHGLRRRRKRLRHSREGAVLGTCPAVN